MPDTDDDDGDGDDHDKEDGGGAGSDDDHNDCSIYTPSGLAQFCIPFSKI